MLAVVNRLFGGATSSSALILLQTVRTGSPVSTPLNIFLSAPLASLVPLASFTNSAFLVEPGNLCPSSRSTSDNGSAIGLVSFEIVAGARRYRAAKMAEAPTVPVRIVNLTDAEALEAQLIENLQRRDVYPLEEAKGFQALLNLEDPKYSIEQIAAKVGKSPAYCLALCVQPHKAAYVVYLLMWRWGRPRIGQHLGGV